MADTLRLYISDRTKGAVARGMAINIATDCTIHDLEDNLLDVALDDQEEIHIRCNAIRSLGKLGSPASLHKLEPLLNLTPDLDPQDEIKGAALQILWPRYITAETLFRTLTVPRDSRLIGRYQQFIYRLDVDGLSPSGAAAGLKWIKLLSFDNFLSVTFGRLVAAVLTAAWTESGQPEVLASFADLYCSLTRNAGDILVSINSSKFATVYSNAPPERRRNLLIAVDRTLRDRDVILSLLGPWQLVAFEDLDWLLRDLINGRSELSEQRLIELITGLIGSRQLEEIAFIWDYAQRNGALADALVRQFSINLDSPHAQWLRKNHQEQLRARQDLSLTPSRSQQVRQILDQCASDVRAWWRLNVALHIGDAGYQTYASSWRI
jgi:hypothetical protein